MTECQHRDCSMEARWNLSTTLGEYLACFHHAAKACSLPSLVQTISSLATKGDN